MFAFWWDALVLEMWILFPWELVSLSLSFWGLEYVNFLLFWVWGCASTPIFFTYSKAYKFSLLFWINYVNIDLHFFQSWCISNSMCSFPMLECALFFTQFIINLRINGFDYLYIGILFWNPSTSYWYIIWGDFWSIFWYDCILTFYELDYN